MIFLNANKNSQKVPITLIDSAENLVTGITAPTIQISKNGAAYATPSVGTWTDLANGDYTVTLNETDSDSFGLLLMHEIVP